MRARRTESGIWVEEHGDAGDVLLLVHGLGANGAVWDPLVELLEGDWKGRILVPDLRGHGRSVHCDNYSYGTFAADLVGLLDSGSRVHIIGHSLGGAIGACLGTGWFGREIQSVLALSVKCKWSADDIQKGREAAKIPVRMFQTRDEAIQRYLRVAGLATVGLAAGRSAEAGVAEAGGLFRLAADQRIFGCASLGVEYLMAGTRCTIGYATGAKDPIATPQDLESAGFKPSVIGDAGHNVHLEAPQQVLSRFRSLLQP